MGLFERYLTIWVALGIAAGVGLGLVLPGFFQAVAGLEIAQVNLVVAVFIWVSSVRLKVEQIQLVSDGCLNGLGSVGLQGA